MRPRFTTQRFPFVPLRVTLRGHQFALEALLDTGFEGFLALPSRVLLPCGSPDGETVGELADGTRVRLAHYHDAAFEVGDFSPFRGYIVATGNVPLVGRGISDRFRVILEFGRELILEPPSIDE